MEHFLTESTTTHFINNILLLLNYIIFKIIYNKLIIFVIII